MHLDRMTRAYARRALRQAVSEFLFDPNVSLIDFGHPEHDGRLALDEVALRIHVRKKHLGAALESAIAAGETRPIPPSIGGFPTDVPEGIYRPHLWWWGGGWRRPSTNLRARRADPLRGGLSISTERHYTYGTLGGLVIDRATGAEMILSNWHVLVGDWGARRGQRIYQPGRLDGGTSASTVARLTRDAMAANLDAAVASLSGQRRLLNDQYELGPVRGVKQAELGLEVVKSGRKSGVTSGHVTAIDGVARIRYNRLERIIRHVVTIEPQERFDEVSAPGDSGSWWLDAATMEAVGLHFAGSNAPERALALDMPVVLEALNVDIVAGTGLERARAAAGRRRVPVPA